MLKTFTIIFITSSVLALECRQLTKNSVLKSIPGANIIELYTSEGCSSCPPADRWLNKLIERDDLWHHVIPIKFHVDYWNYIGHRDPFSSKESTRRQRAYGNLWRAPHIYTPEFVLNNQEWRSWFRKVPTKKRRSGNGNLELKRNDSRTINFSFSSNDNYGSYSILVVEQRNNIEHKIKRGENAGKVLKHHFSVVSQDRIRLNKVDGKYTLEYKLKPSVIGGVCLK
jgi:hypothetical protein